MAVTLKAIQGWNPEKITADVLTQAFNQAEQLDVVTEADINFAEGLVQKFKGLLLSSMEMTRVTKEQFDKIMSAPVSALPVEARRWRIRCAQLMLWLEQTTTSRV